MIVADDVLWWWDAAHGLRTMVGGDPAFTRASSAMEVPDNAGMVRVTVADVPRFSFATFGSERVPALHLEPADTNVLKQSNDLDLSPWGNSGTPTLTQGITAPDGQALGWTIEDDDGAGFEFRLQNNTITSDSTSWTISAFFKKTVSASSFPGFRLEFFGGTAIVAAVTVNTDDGTLTGRSGEPPDLTHIESVGGWWWVTLTFANNGTGNTSLRYQIFPAVNTDASGTWAASTTETVGIWEGAAINRGYGTSPISTTPSTAIRAAESMQWTGAPDPQAMVIYLDVVLVDPFTTQNVRFFEISSSADAASRIVISARTDPALRVIYDPGTAVIAEVSLTSPAAGDRIQAVLSLEADGSGRLIVSHNGGTASGADFAAAAEGMATAWAENIVWLNSVGTTAINAAKYRRLVMVKPGNLESALDGTEDSELIAEMAEIEKRQDGSLRELF